MNIEQQLQDLIQKNLPAQAAGEMKKFIEESEELAERHEQSLIDLDQTGKQIARLQEENRYLNDQIEKHEKLDIRGAALDDREKEIQKREDRQAMGSMSIELGLLRTHTSKIENLVEKVFGHPGVVVTNEKNTTRQVAVETSPGYQSLQTVTDSDTDTKTTKHTKE